MDPLQNVILCPLFGLVFWSRRETARGGGGLWALPGGGGATGHWSRHGALRGALDGEFAATETQVWDRMKPVDFGLGQVLIQA